MYRRRLFYDLATGEVIRAYTAQGDIRKPYPPEAEADALGLTNWGVFAWEEYTPEAEAQFAPFDADGNARMVSVRVDVSQQPHSLIFEYAAESGEEQSGA